MDSTLSFDSNAKTSPVNGIIAGDGVHWRSLGGFHPLTIVAFSLCAIAGLFALSRNLSGVSIRLVLEVVPVDRCDNSASTSTPSQVLATQAPSEIYDCDDLVSAKMSGMPLRTVSKVSLKQAFAFDSQYVLIYSDGRHLVS